MAEVQANTKNKNVLGRIFVVIVVLSLITGGYLFWLHLSKFESTDDAQVDGQLYAISSRINGHVIEVKVDDETEYGYLWWLASFGAEGKKAKAVFMSGNGGNKIGYVRDLGLVFVITSTNYNTKGMHDQTARILDDIVAATTL